MSASELSKRALLTRILNIVERTETSMSANADAVKAALDNLDLQMGDLQTRLTAEAAELMAAISQAALATEDEAALTSAAQRIMDTANEVAGLALPSAVVPTPEPDPAPPADA